MLLKRLPSESLIVTHPWLSQAESWSGPSRAHDDAESILFFVVVGGQCLYDVYPQACFQPVPICCCFFLYFSSTALSTHILKTHAPTWWPTVYQHIITVDVVLCRCCWRTLCHMPLVLAQIDKYSTKMQEAANDVLLLETRKRLPSNPPTTDLQTTTAPIHSTQSGHKSSRFDFYLKEIHFPLLICVFQKECTILIFSTRIWGCSGYRIIKVVFCNLQPSSFSKSVPTVASGHFSDLLIRALFWNRQLKLSQPCIFSLAQFSFTWKNFRAYQNVFMQVASE